MKVLFVASGNDDRYAIAPFIKSQGDSLEASGVAIDYFTIKGKGPVNYLRNVGLLKKHLAANDYDLIHAHYALCGWIAVLTLTGIPIVLSLMGADAVGTPKTSGRLTLKSRLLLSLTFLVQPFVKKIISKSANIERAVHRKSISEIIPNGVRIDQFTNPINQLSRSDLGLSNQKQYVLFLGSPNDLNKNITLLQQAKSLLDLNEVEILNIYDVPHDRVVAYLQVADVLALCSFSEGSPNVIKEAMVCNRPIVSTNIGDVEWLIEKVEGCYLSSFVPSEFSKQLEKALSFSKTHGQTLGRKRIMALGLDAVSTSKRIRSLYQIVIDQQQWSLETTKTHSL